MIAFEFSAKFYKQQNYVKNIEYKNIEILYFLNTKNNFWLPLPGSFDVDANASEANPISCDLGSILFFIKQNQLKC